MGATDDTAPNPGAAPHARGGRIAAEHTAKPLRRPVARRREPPGFSVYADIPLGRTRISAHSGEVVVGNFGGETLCDYRALSDAVNVAARLEGMNRYLGTELCVSETICAANPKS